MYTHLTDNELIEKIRHAGDQLAFRELYDRYSDLIYSVACTKVKLREDAKEIVQITFLKFWNSRANLHIQSSLKAYFYTAVRNNVINFYSQQAGAKVVSLDVISEQAVGADYDTQRQVDVSQARTFYHHSLDALPEKCREVFVMSRKGFSMNEISKAYNISPKTVEAQIGKALKILRKKFSEGFHLLTFFF